MTTRKRSPSRARKQPGGKQPHTRVTVDGITFASATEARFYRYLRRLLKRGDIVHIEPHPRFTFQQPFTNPRGIKRSKRWYTADFRVTLPNGEERVYEVKGADRKAIITTDFKLRRDIVEQLFGIAVTTVFPDDRSGAWIDIDTKEVLI